MSYLIFAILAQFLNSIAVTIDKFLLTKTIPDPLIYIFYFSLISLTVLLAIPFLHFPPVLVFILSSVSTLTWTAGAYLMFKALKSGQVQRVIPLIGALTPIFLLFLTAGHHPLKGQQIMAVAILIAGLILLTLENLKGQFNKSELLLEIIAALFFAVSYYLLSLSFEKQDYFTVLVWSRPILIPLGIVMLMIPTLRKKITSFIALTFSSQPITGSTNNKWPSILAFIAGQISAAASELLLLFSISLANPAIVNSLQGIKYVFLLVFSLILGKKFPTVFQNNFHGMYGLSQILGVVLIGIGLYILAMAV